MKKKSAVDYAARPELLAFSAGVAVAVAVIYVAVQWSPASSAIAAEPPAVAAECVFLNHVRQGPGHPYRQERGEKCRYEFDPSVPDQGGPQRY